MKIIDNATSQFSLSTCFWWMTWVALVACDVPFGVAVASNQGFLACELAVVTTVVGIALGRSSKHMSCWRSGAIFGWGLVHALFVAYLIGILPPY